MYKQYNEFDIKLNENDFIKRHYECLPFIGEKYVDSRLLLVGESHYVPDDEVYCVDREDFYDISFDDLAEGKYKDWIHTRKVFERRVYNHDNLKAFFSNPATEIAKIINHTSTSNFSTNQIIEAMHQYAFMNYFKRPSYDAGQTIEGLTETDYQYAYEISRYIIDVLKPTLIIFLSKKAFYAFCDSDKEGRIRSKYTVKCVSHPSCPWWNRQRKDGKCAREDFHNFVAEIL